MIPKSVKGRIFVFLTFINLGMASYFASINFFEQCALSGITAFLCATVWLAEFYKKNE